MYKFLLCWRYLRTRYIALFSIVSVMLGVATMIVVNSVMEGFSHEMQERIHGILSDIVFESSSLDGIPDAERHMQEIRRVAGDQIEGMSPTVHVPAMLSFKVGRQYVNKQISLIGVDEATYSTVSDFGRYLQHPENRAGLDFKLKDGGYDTANHEAAVAGKGVERPQMSMAGWLWRKQSAAFMTRAVAPPGSVDKNPFAAAPNPLGESPAEGDDFDPAKEQHEGCVLGIALVSYRNQDGSDSFLSLPGDDVDITYPTAGTPPKPLSAKFTVVDFYESKMNEYDSSFVFVPIRKLQELRGTIDPATDSGNFNSIQIRLKPGADMDAVRDKIRAAFPSQMYIVSTWRDKQGALLAAVQMETAVLNVLLFMIIAVAGFGILAIFLMIVVEKTRDIGILKSLGATGSGIMSIFLAYGLSLGIVGAGVGVALGLAFVVYINEIADVLGRLTGRPVFDPSIYYFHEIPTIIDPLTVVLVAAGAMLIAVLASILPAWRAASLHPVEALRYE
jgi:lipoprotein-releasing system permease protein